MILQTALIRRVVLLGAFALGTFAVIACSSAKTSPAAAQIPSPALLIAVQDEHVLAIADPQTNKVVGKVALGGEPNQVAVSEDGKFAFASAKLSGRVGGGNVTKGVDLDLDKLSGETTQIPGYDYISVIDLVTQKEVRRVETGLGSLPQDVVYAGGKVYYTSNAYKLIGRYDPATDRIDWMQGTGQGHTHLLVITKDLKQIFAVNTSSDSVSAMAPWATPGAHAEPIWEVTTIPVGHGPQGIAMSPDEKEVWVATKLDNGLSIIDVATKKVIRTLKVPGIMPLRLKFAPDGKRVLLVDEYSGEVLVYDAATRKVIKRITIVEPTEKFEVRDADAIKDGVHITPKILMHELMIVPDGSRAYVDVMGSNRIDVLDLKTLEVTGSIHTGPSPKGLAWAVRR
jgi:YVTN family beta-propeller protein